MRIMITGNKGMLGKDLTRILKDDGNSIIDFDLMDDKRLDVRNYEGVIQFSKKQKPDFIIHLAAKTNVDACETEINDAYLTNTIGTKNIALACQELGIPMLYTSTGAVFDGTKIEPYTEFDTPNPQSIYAKSKCEGGKIVQALLNKYFIVRIGWMFGGGKDDKKFVAKIIELAQQRNELQVVTDKIGSPTYTVDVSEGIKQLIKTKQYGLYHMVNNGFCTRYECARKIIEFAGLSRVTVKPVTSAYFPLPAPRPRMEALINFHLELLGKNTMRPWEDALKEYIDWSMRN